jgi:membrane protein implicated in regulation of membrane protease activity
MNIIILLPILSGFGLLYWASQLEDEDYSILRMLFQLMFIPLTWLSIHFAVIDATITYASNTDLVALLGDFVWYSGWIAFIIGSVLSFIVLKRLYELIMQKKEQNESAKHD